MVLQLNSSWDMPSVFCLASTEQLLLDSRERKHNDLFSWTLEQLANNLTRSFALRFAKLSRESDRQHIKI